MNSITKKLLIGYMILLSLLMQMTLSSALSWPAVKVTATGMNSGDKVEVYLYDFVLDISIEGQDKSDVVQALIREANGMVTLTPSQPSTTKININHVWIVFYKGGTIGDIISSSIPLNLPQTYYHTDGHISLSVKWFIKYVCTSGDALCKIQ